MGFSSRLPGGIATIAVCAILLMAVVVPVTAGMSGTLETRISGSSDLASSDRMVQSSDVGIEVSQSRSRDITVSVDGVSKPFRTQSSGFIVLSPSMCFSCRGDTAEAVDMATGRTVSLSYPVTISQSPAGLEVSGGEALSYPGNPWVMYTYQDGFPAATHAATPLPAVAGDGVMAYADRPLATASPTWFVAVPEEGYEFDYWELPEGPLPSGSISYAEAHFSAAGGEEKAEEPVLQAEEVRAYAGDLVVEVFGRDRDYGHLEVYTDLGSPGNTVIYTVIHTAGSVLGYGDSGPGPTLYVDPVQVPQLIASCAICEAGEAYGPGGAPYAVGYTQTDYEGQQVRAVASVAVPASTGHAAWYAPLEWESSASADPVLSALLAVIPLICAAALMVLVCRWTLPRREGGEEDVFNSRR